MRQKLHQKQDEYGLALGFHSTDNPSVTLYAYFTSMDTVRAFNSYTDAVEWIEALTLEDMCNLYTDTGLRCGILSVTGWADLYQCSDGTMRDSMEFKDWVLNR